MLLGKYSKVEVLYNSMHYFTIIIKESMNQNWNWYYSLGIKFQNNYIMYLQDFEYYNLMFFIVLLHTFFIS